MAATWLRLPGAIATTTGLLAFVPAVSPAAEGPSWRIERGNVRVLVPLKPGGAFESKTSSLDGTLTVGASRPLLLTGEVSVDLATIDTGIALRNRHLREKYLEVAKGRGFDKAVLSEILLNDADGGEFQGRTAFKGTLLLHGVKREVVGEGEIRRAAGNLLVEASFPLTLTDFGIEPPEYLGVGVASRVAVRVVFTAAPARATRP